MSAAKTIAPHLPYLRRYARALTGSQRSGDAYVRASLEALLEGSATMHDRTSPKIALYSVFHSIWSSTVSQLDHDQAGIVKMSPDMRLQALPPRNREALLLTSVEGFSAAEAGEILGMDATGVQNEIVAAQEAIEAQLATSVLIIEDEPIIALDLESLVKDLGHDVAGVATTRDEAVALAKASKPGLVLADVRLADGSSGIDAATDILTGFDVPVIFITAYPERLLSGDRPEPAYLITKPFLAETVKATIGQALFFHGARRTTED
jgi:DNA-directed RNA polymerase specialized sigma24 family protein